MLVVTTPLGTGDSVHQDELLHPVFPHVHLIDGHIVSDYELADAAAEAETHLPPSRPPQRLRLGAGSGADAAGFGLGLVPALPVMGLVLITAPGGRLAAVESRRPSEFRASPEDPPPNRFA